MAEEEETTPWTRGCGTASIFIIFVGKPSKVRGFGRFGRMRCVVDGGEHLFLPPTLGSRCSMFTVLGFTRSFFLRGNASNAHSVSTLYSLYTRILSYIVFILPSDWIMKCHVERRDGRTT